MKKINSKWYTEGKFVKKLMKILDRENKNLYSKGLYPTKIRKDDLPKDYIRFQSRTIWYMTGYLKTSKVQDVYYIYVKENHLFKDDYLYISYNNKLKIEKSKYGFEDCIDYDFCICGNDIIPILFGIEKNSKINTTKVRNKIMEKFEWWKKNEVDDYKNWFKNREVDDIFEYYKERIN